MTIAASLLIIQMTAHSYITGADVQTAVRDVHSIIPLQVWWHRRPRSGAHQILIILPLPLSTTHEHLSSNQGVTPNSTMTGCERVTQAPTFLFMGSPTLWLAGENPGSTKAHAIVHLFGCKGKRSFRDPLEHENLPCQ